MTVFNDNHHDNALTRAAQKKSGVPYYIKAIETSSYNIDFYDTSIISTNTAKNDPVKTEKETLTWKDWFAYIGNNSNPDIDKSSYVGNTIEDEVKNAAEYFGNNVFTLEVEKFTLVRCTQEVANIWHRCIIQRERNE